MFMKIIILECNEQEKIINHFISYGSFEFILFKKPKERIDKDYYKINNVSIIAIQGFSNESTQDKLLKIQGSIKDSFFIVYSSDINNFDIEKIIISHKSNQKIATLVEHNKSMCAILLESEALDYTRHGKSLEREALLRIGEEEELLIYK